MINNKTPMNLETETINIKQLLKGFEFHDDLKDKQHKSILLSRATDSIIHGLYPPIMLRSGGQYQLICRQWVFAYYIAHDIDQFPVLVTEDQSLVERILAYDKKEVSMLLRQTSEADRAASAAKDAPRVFKNRNTKARVQNVKSGQTCPFCNNAPLRRMRKKILQDDGTERFIVTCDNSFRNGKYHCDFFAELNSDEYDKFVAHLLPTKDWLTIIEAKKCPSHPDESLMRRVENGGMGDEYEECANYHRFKDKKLLDRKCEYRREK